MRCGVGIQCNRPRGTNTLHGFSEEVFRGGDVSLLAEVKIDCSPDFIDSTIQISPPALHPYICLVTSPRTANWPRIPAPALLEFRHVTLDPAQNGGMGQQDSAFGHHFHQVPCAELVPQIPANAQNDDFLVELPTFEQILP